MNKPRQMLQKAIARGSHDPPVGHERAPEPRSPGDLAQTLAAHDEVRARLASNLLGVGLAVLVAALALLAWLMRWTQDDAYITYRYAEHLARGWGPVWNQGEAIEGYTNFLWMLMLAGTSLSLDPVVASEALGVASFAGTLLVTFMLARRVLDAKSSLLATALVGTNYSFLSYATGGLETQLDTLLTTAILGLAQRAWMAGRWPPASLAGISLLVTLAVMTRPDSVVVSAVAGVFALIGIARGERSWTGRARKALLLVGPAALLAGAWLAWKLAFYGSILPNTFHAKLGTSSYLTYVRGAAYVAWYFVSYWLAAVLAYLAFAALRQRPTLRIGTGYQPLLAYVVLWLAYVVQAGGDIMEFRQIVPAVPALYVLLFGALHALSPGLRPAIVVAVLLCAGNAVHARFFPAYVRPQGIGNVPQLSAWVGDDDLGSWAVMGRALGAALKRDPTVTIAVAPAGAMPYYSGARTVDMLGLNDPWVARHGYIRKNCTVCYAHARIATFEHLLRSRTHLLIGYPKLISAREPAAEPMQVVLDMFWREAVDYERMPRNAQLVRIPLGGELALAAAYLAPHPRVDALLARGAWHAQPIRQHR